MVSGHAGPGMTASDEDEGQQVKSLINEILLAGNHKNLNLTIHNVSPPQWAPDKLQNMQ
jgi:hypothetical protein